MRRTLDGARIQPSILASTELDALASAQRALGDLENAIQHPFAPGEMLPMDAESPTIDKLLQKANQ